MKRLKIEYNHSAGMVTWFMSGFATIFISLRIAADNKLIEPSNQWYTLVLVIISMCLITIIIGFILSFIASVVFGKVTFEEPDIKMFPYVTKKEATFYRKILENFYLDPELVCNILVLPEFSIQHLKELIYSHHQKYERTQEQTNASIIEILAKSKANYQLKSELMGIMLDLTNQSKIKDDSVLEFDFNPNRMPKEEYFYRREMGSNEYGLYANDIPLIINLIAEFNTIKEKISF